MNPSRTITIPHLGRVEGHGGIYVTIVGNEVHDVDMAIHEGSRYYEALLVGKHFLEVQGIITRICAICSANHTVAALMALEDALGVPETERTKRLRGLMLLGAAIESHALHVFALALPDYLGYDSIISMAADHREAVTEALRLKQLGNRVQELVGGRPVHPVNALVGGFGRLPTHDQLRGLRQELGEGIDQAMRFVELAAGIELPAWASQPTVFVALRPGRSGYGFRGSSLCTSRGEEFPVTSYRDVVREFTVEHSHAKHAALASGESYMVGSLARIALWGDRLGGRALEARQRLVPAESLDNVLVNNWAQLVEIVHSLERGMELCDELLAMEQLESEQLEYRSRAGLGIAAIEVPRGTLVHEYELDGDGIVTSANIITPTAQNLANVERDLRHSLEVLLKVGGEPCDTELARDLGMIARAYDPCISCSVHVVRIDA